jgi:hypothetical protein
LLFFIIPNFSNRSAVAPHTVAVKTSAVGVPGRGRAACPPEKWAWRVIIHFFLCVVMSDYVSRVRDGNGEEDIHQFGDKNIKKSSISD